jgi:predicted nucleic acid-binding protein
MNAFDANVFAYAFDDDEPIKNAKTNELLDRLLRHPSETIIPWQVAGEFLAVLRKWQDAGRVTSKDVSDYFRDFRGMFPLKKPQLKIFATSMSLRSRYSLSDWDSMLLAACKLAKVDILYSEDMSHGTSYDGVTVINPFG